MRTSETDHPIKAVPWRAPGSSAGRCRASAGSRHPPPGWRRAPPRLPHSGSGWRRAPGRPGPSRPGGSAARRRCGSAVRPRSSDGVLHPALEPQARMPKLPRALTRFCMPNWLDLFWAASWRSHRWPRRWRCTGRSRSHPTTPAPSRTRSMQLWPARCREPRARCGKASARHGGIWRRPMGACNGHCRWNERGQRSKPSSRQDWRRL